jgi:hypothetical protein
MSDGYIATKTTSDRDVAPKTTTALLRATNTTASDGDAKTTVT